MKKNMFWKLLKHSVNKNINLASDKDLKNQIEESQKPKQ
jgi:hypothetical protein